MRQDLVSEVGVVIEALEHARRAASDVLESESDKDRRAAAKVAAAFAYHATVGLWDHVFPILGIARPSDPR